MRKEIETIIDLQRFFSSFNSPEMEERGQLINSAVPSKIKNISSALASAIGIEETDLVIVGSDGLMRKSKVPWVRFGSSSRSPKADKGWCCAFLFRPQADGVYLCLRHGINIKHFSSKNPNSGDNYKLFGNEKIESPMVWGHQVLETEIDGQELRIDIDLGRVNRLAQAYEASTLVAKLYRRSEIPSDTEIERDLLRFATMLGKIYESERLGKMPKEAERQFEGTQELVEETASGRKPRGRGQGIGLATPEERKAVELHAMAKARAYLERKGFEAIEDVSSNHSYDFKAVRDGSEYIFEIKGTTGAGDSILLTSGEVEAHRNFYPNNGLIVVHSIELKRDLAEPEASGGTLVAAVPWLIDDERLRPTVFQYRPADP